MSDQFYNFKTPYFDDIFIFQEEKDKHLNGYIVSKICNGQYYSFKKEHCKKLEIHEVVAKKLLGEILMTPEKSNFNGKYPERKFENILNNLFKEIYADKLNNLIPFKNPFLKVLNDK